MKIDTRAIGRKFLPQNTKRLDDIYYIVLMFYNIHIHMDCKKYAWMGEELFVVAAILDVR